MSLEFDASDFLLFQSTHSQGVRQGSECFHLSGFQYFNPRTHKECDYMITYIYKINKEISIHALTRSATS
ncbi:MAG: hypothetical protein ACFWTY_05370 [Shouchella clausii]